jgi:hypothetical protein
MSLVSDLPNWTSLRAIGNSSAVKLTVFIPLIGYLILFNATVVQYLHLANQFVGNTPESNNISVRLLLVYFGLCLLAAGSALYSFFCPPEIKQYPTATSYVGADRNNIGDVGFESIQEQLLKSRHFADRYNKLHNRFDQEISEELDTEREKRARDQADIAILNLYFEYLNQSYPWWRMLSGLSFITGLTFLAIPSISFFIRVVELVLYGQ